MREIRYTTPHGDWSQTWPISTFQQQGRIANRFQPNKLPLHHIDDLFQWLANALLQHFELQVVQFWAMQSHFNGSATPLLRRSISKQVNLPLAILNHPHVAAVAGSFRDKQQERAFQDVGHLFTRYHATLLRRYGLHYCAGTYLSGEVLLPPPVMSGGTLPPTPLKCSTLLFLHQLPRHNILPMVKESVQQALLLAVQQGLLLSGRALPSGQRTQGNDPQPPQAQHVYRSLRNKGGPKKPPDRDKQAH